MSGPRPATISRSTIAERSGGCLGSPDKPTMHKAQRRAEARQSDYEASATVWLRPAIDPVATRSFPPQNASPCRPTAPAHYWGEEAAGNDVDVDTASPARSASRTAAAAGAFSTVAWTVTIGTAPSPRSVLMVSCRSTLPTMSPA
jgi:hypothetical protein